MESRSRWAATGALLGGLAVLLGAFGAHAWKESLQISGRLETFETAARYQMFHAMALILAASGGLEPRWARHACRFFLAGILLFCGSLDGISAGGPRWIGALTPLGGLCFMAGWVSLAAGYLRKPAR